MTNLFFPSEDDRTAVKKIVQVLNVTPGRNKLPWAKRNNNVEVWCLTVQENLCIHIAGGGHPTVHVTPPASTGTHEGVVIDVTGSDGPWVALVRGRLPGMLKEAEAARKEAIRVSDEFREAQLEIARGVFK